MVWPTQDEVRQYSIIVLITVILFTAFVALPRLLLRVGDPLAVRPMSDTMPEPEGDPEVELETVLDDAEGGWPPRSPSPRRCSPRWRVADAGPVGVDPADASWPRPVTTGR